MKVSVVIPCYNERNTIGELVRAVRASPIAALEIVLVDDCSTDGTRQLIEDELANLVERALYHESNQGKGACLRTGFREATGEIIIIQDADLGRTYEEGKKVGWRDGVRAIYAILKYNLLRRKTVTPNATGAAEPS